MDIKKYLEHSNEYLGKNYQQKHTIITIDDVLKTYKRPTLFSINADAKTSKGTSLGYLTGIMYLAPYKTVGYNTCPFATKGCSQACLYSAGRGRFYSVTRARIIKTLAFLHDTELFYNSICKSIIHLNKKAA